MSGEAAAQEGTQDLIFFFFRGNLHLLFSLLLERQDNEAGRMELKYVDV